MVNFYRLILFIILSFPVFSFAADVGEIDLGGWIKQSDGTYAKAFGNSSITLSSPPTGLKAIENATVQTSKGLQSFPIEKTASVDVSRVGKAVANFAKRVGPVGMAIGTASLICELSDICNIDGLWKLGYVNETTPSGSSVWNCSGFGNMSFSACKNDIHDCDNPNYICYDDAVAPDGKSFTFMKKYASNGQLIGMATLTRTTAWTPTQNAGTVPTQTDWDSKQSALNDSRFVPELIDKSESIPTSGIPTLTANQKKQLGLDSVPTKDAQGNVTGREDTMTQIEAVDAGTADSPGRVIIKETKTSIKYDTNNTQISSTTNTSYSNQPEATKPQGFEIKFDEVAPATIETYNVPNTFNASSWGTGQCPPDIPISLVSGFSFNIPTAPACETAEMVYPFTLMIASVMGIYIIAGVKGGSK